MDKVAHGIGIVFIAIGVITFIMFIASFDWSTYNSIKGLVYTYGDEIEYMQDELAGTWIMALGSLIVNVAIGVTLMVLGKILSALNDIKSRAIKQ